MPVKTELDSFECRDGLGYTRITGERQALRAEVTFLGPMGENAEVHQVRLKNPCPRARSIKLLS